MRIIYAHKVHNKPYAPSVIDSLEAIVSNIVLPFHEHRPGEEGTSMTGASECRWNGAPVRSMPTETSLCVIRSDPDTGIPITIPVVSVVINQDIINAD